VPVEGGKRRGPVDVPAGKARARGSGGRRSDAGSRPSADGDGNSTPMEMETRRRWRSAADAHISIGGRRSDVGSRPSGCLDKVGRVGRAGLGLAVDAESCAGRCTARARAGPGAGYVTGT
jgi:hypothetical protein